jgi:hypothetical protein
VIKNISYFSEIITDGIAGTELIKTSVLMN